MWSPLKLSFLFSLKPSHHHSPAHTNMAPQETTQETNAKLFKMVALDLDGTLLTKTHEISQESVKYLRHLHSKGIIICIATGRSASACAQVIHELDFDYPKNGNGLEGFPLVCTNGAKGLYVQKGDESNVRSTSQPGGNPILDGRLISTQIFHLPVSNELTRKTLALSKSLGCPTNYYIGHDIYAQPLEDWHYDVTQAYMDLTGVKITHVSDDYEAAMERGLPSKLLVLSGEKNIDDICQKCADHLDGEAKVIRGSPPFFVEILDNDVCKGIGLEKMCENLGVSLDECICFGDGYNDIEFIEKSGLGFAMKNAVQSLKSIADGVTEYTNDEDGVIRKLKELEESGRFNFDS